MDATLGTYQFVGNNCADFTNDILGVAGISANVGQLFSDSTLAIANNVGFYIDYAYGDKSLWGHPAAAGTLIPSGILRALANQFITSPIVLDLDGNGISYTPLASSDVFF